MLCMKSPSLSLSVYNLGFISYMCAIYCDHTPPHHPCQSHSSEDPCSLTSSLPTSTIYFTLFLSLGSVSTMVEVKGHWCSICTLLPPSLGFQGLNSSLWASMIITFTCWAILLAFSSTFVGCVYVCVCMHACMRVCSQVLYRRLRLQWPCHSKKTAFHSISSQVLVLTIFPPLFHDLPWATKGSR